MTFGVPPSRTWTNGGPSSPTLNFSEDLSRFPSESLHSFSFAHVSEDILQGRQNILKRSIDFLRDKLGWVSSHPGLVNAQAKVSGDVEVQGMMELLSRANVLGIDTGSAQRSRFIQGPLTGPAFSDGGNVFEKAFLPRSESQTRSQEAVPPERIISPKENILPSRPGSSHPEPSLSSEASISDPPDPQSPVDDLIIPGNSHTSRERGGLKRTYTDVSLLTLQTRLIEALAKPYTAKESGNDNHPLSPTPIPAFGKSLNGSLHAPSTTAVHGHSNRSVPQAIFTTATSAPWTILAANDLACLVIGVTKAEVRKLSILEVVRKDKRAWLENRLQPPRSEETSRTQSPSGKSTKGSPSSTSSLSIGNGVTAQLLSKPSSREIAKQKSKAGEVKQPRPVPKLSKVSSKVSHGVLLCGDVVPIQKRNGATGSASLWVKEKRGGLIWVLEEIHEDAACLSLDAEGLVRSSVGSIKIIFGESKIESGTEIQDLIPQLPVQKSDGQLEVDFEQVEEIQYYAAQNAEGACIPVSVFAAADSRSLRVSSFPHIAGIMVLSANTLDVTSSNSAFSAALFGISAPDGLNITTLVPQFDKLLQIITEEDDITLTDGMVIPEHTFRRAQDLLTLRDANATPASIFLKPPGLAAKHRDGSNINVDVQMRIVRSEKVDLDGSVIEEIDEDVNDITGQKSVAASTSELVYALWVTYSRELHSTFHARGSASPVPSKPVTPRQPSPGQNDRSVSPQPADSDDNKPDSPSTSLLTQQIEEATSQPISESPSEQTSSMAKQTVVSVRPKEPPKKKKIADFTILEDMGQGAYGQVKLARYTKTSKKVVLKYVTKKRILVDTWTRDRRLGTVPLEIHVLDYLRRDGLKHPNIVEMTDFFEDDINYYIEMVPHGLPGMDLFDYIEMRSTIDEAECRNIFLQVVAALHHLHTKALVVHRDIKDENIILDGENKVKLIDFGSAAYIKNGPFEVFVGTIGMASSLPPSLFPVLLYPLSTKFLRLLTTFRIDYAAPEVLQGKAYRGKEQDVWALGILLYTLVYKENPFYSIDEIMDHELRIPWIMSEASIDIIKAMLNRDVDQRLTITQVMEHPWCRVEEEGEGATEG